MKRPFHTLSPWTNHPLLLRLMFTNFENNWEKSLQSTELTHSRRLPNLHVMFREAYSDQPVVAFLVG
jgi:hypothetical protein